MQDLRAALEQALGDTYAIERELGGGGMSRTYLAVERAYDRRVVVKVLAPELLAGMSVERFRREVLMAAQLQHPHIVPVLTSGDAGGLPWFSMPFVDGLSLRQRLERGPLSIPEAVSILRDVARALSYAHSRGVVHRDIKPDNVLLSGGSATVTDFGIAKAITAARGGSGPQNETLTIAGTSLGTPTYMAPEQAAGDPKTDHRADVYAFGIMAWELLAGRPPFQASSPARLLAAHLVDTPPDVREARPDAPAALAELIASCLQKDPDARPQDSADLARALELVTTSGSAAQVPTVLAGRRVRLWRAIGIWAAAMAFVVLLAWAATETIGLPDWVLPGSAALMLAGLPAILATAYVQRTVHHVYTTTPQLTPGGTPSMHGTMATLAIKASPHVSWRRTWVGGAVAVGAFVLLVTGFMATRALGIGPAASLRGTGEFDEKETLVIADFRSPPGDSLLGATVSEALRTDLAQSTALDVLTRNEIRDALTLMRRPSESQVPFALAREIATREGAKAVLDGEVVQLGQSYVVSARLVAALDGRELASFRETAETEDELIAALGRVSRDVRERAGESLRTIRAAASLARVTTPSLAALRNYVEGGRLAYEAGDVDRGLQLLEEAVQLDTAFAMAWGRLAVLLTNDGRDRPRALAALSTAFRHRSRLTEFERLRMEALYHLLGPQADLGRARAAYEAALRLDSLNSSVVNNLGFILGMSGDYNGAEELYAKAAKMPGATNSPFRNAVSMRILNRRPPAMLDSALAVYRAALPDDARYWESAFEVAINTGDLERADSLSRAAYRDGAGGSREIIGARNAAIVATHRGRWREAMDWGARSGAALVQAEPSPATRFARWSDSAWYAATAEHNPARARAIMARGMARRLVDSMAPVERPWDVLSEVAAASGDAALARMALAGYERDRAASTPNAAALRSLLAARVALTEERWDAALDLLHTALETRAAYPAHIYPAIALAHDHAGRPDSAVRYFELAVAAGDPEGRASSRWVAPTHRRLGELYEAKGDSRKAIEHYARFAEQWKDADPELQVQVREVKARLGELRKGLEGSAD